MKKIKSENENITYGKIEYAISKDREYEYQPHKNHETNIEKKINNDINLT